MAQKEQRPPHLLMSDYVHFYASKDDSMGRIAANLCDVDEETIEILLVLARREYAKDEPMKHIIVGLTLGAWLASRNRL